MEDIHKALRFGHTDEHAGHGSFLKGKSTHNQRIERYWRDFRHNMGEFYMQIFKNMQDNNELDIKNPLHFECLRYCFGNLIREDLVSTRKNWF